MGKILIVSSAVGVGLSLAFITAGMMAAGQVWQSSLALGVFIAFWGGLGFGSMIGGVVYLTRIDEAAKALKAEGRAAKVEEDTPVALATAPIEYQDESHSADAA